MGDNTVVPTFAPTTGEVLVNTFIRTFKLMPDSAVTVTISAYNTLTTDTRTLDQQEVFAGQGWIFENTEPDVSYKWKLFPNEELVVNLSAAVQCTGFSSVSYVLS